MCGRFAAGELTFAQIRDILEGFLGALPEVDADAAPARAGYQICPTDRIAIVRQSGRTVQITSADWQITARNGRALINARIESDGFWRSCLERGRCLIPALGYFEWMQQGGRKIPLYITVKQNAPLCFFAGLMSEEQQGCVILTRPPSPQIAHIHTRMPVILSQAEIAGWLAGETDITSAQARLGNGWEGRFEWHEVAPLRRDALGPEVIEPFEPPQASFDF